MGTMETTPSEVGKMYDQTTPLSDIFNDGQEHLAYWYDQYDETPILEAAQRITRKVADTLGLRPGEHLLDAGCGLGAPAILIAKETGARVTGITISEAQVVEAQKRSSAAGLSDRVHFQHADYGSIPHPDNSFDAIIAIEALMHAQDLDLVLKEFHRVLRPGGRIAISDCTRQERMTDDEWDEIAATFKMNRLLTVPQWVDTLENAGYQVEEYTQCGPRVYGMGLRYLDRANELHETLVQGFGEETVAALKQGYRDYFAPGPGRMGYAILTARKPVTRFCCANCGLNY